MKRRTKNGNKNLILQKYTQELTFILFILFSIYNRENSKPAVVDFSDHFIILFKIYNNKLISSLHNSCSLRRRNHNKEGDANLHIS